ncbi:hypothetical protein EPYR_02090 [Erwinia pyrifoliae DSM 12163]|nr:hypothetical protein EJP617_27840 [Erwinia sp. Ejp617]CAY74470.1 hypothetical protein EPYR_02090 [Erwinia pyrifoliae DSM 12163]
MSPFDSSYHLIINKLGKNIVSGAICDLNEQPISILQALL